MRYEVEVPRTTLRFILMALVVSGLTVLGYCSSPRGEDGSPMFLSLRAARISAYQRDARGWVASLREIQAGLSLLLSSPSVDLLAQDSQVDRSRGELARLQQVLDGSLVPPTLETLHSLLEKTVAATQEAADRTASWISEPTRDNLLSAQHSLECAQLLLGELLGNPWIGGEP